MCRERDTFNIWGTYSPPVIRQSCVFYSSRINSRRPIGDSPRTKHILPFGGAVHCSGVPRLHFCTQTFDGNHALLHMNHFNKHGYYSSKQWCFHIVIWNQSAVIRLYRVFSVDVHFFDYFRVCLFVCVSFVVLEIYRLMF